MYYTVTTVSVNQKHDLDIKVNLDKMLTSIVCGVKT